MKIKMASIDILIDECDLDLIRGYNWCFTDKGYLQGSGGKYRCKYLHRIIAERMGLDMSNFIDHRDRNPKNQQRENLRAATPSQNRANGKKYTNNKSGYKGVSRHRSKWRAYIGFECKLIHLGVFDDSEDAARAYDLAAIQYFGEFARLNFSRN